MNSGSLSRSSNGIVFMSTMRVGLNSSGAAIPLGSGEAFWMLAAMRWKSPEAFADATKYTPQNVGRRLRELENEGVVEVRYEKNHAYYRYRMAESFEDLNRRQIAWFETLPDKRSIASAHTVMRAG
jgi:DNA-binding transcriptional ArsR family regulator